ncbi:hypothetical protein [Candidatus Cyanaurora vandensis]|uniref:hypothetical protein n=1 Tax=Candidatus Cyanaurora vandensis TaxID=2714958 RepID=UPI00257A2563|nr:hypothetical protein [Candidatus Cyanaurora vandensis]
MHQKISEIIAETAAELCWQQYQQRQRIPQINNILEELLRDCELQTTSESAFEQLAYSTRQHFQNRLLQSRSKLYGSEKLG